MSKVILKGSTSGQVELQSNSTAGSGSLTLPIGTDTLIGKNTNDVLTNKIIDGSTNTISISTVNTQIDISVDNLVTLKSLVTRPSVVIMEGRSTPGDGGGGTFYWIAGDNTIPDDVLIVQPTSGSTGRYKRIIDGPLYAKWFGAKGDGITDDINALIAWLAAMANRTHTYNSIELGITGIINSGTYITGKLIINESINIEAQGARLVLKSGTNDDLLLANNVSYIKIYGLFIDGNKTNNSTPAINSGNAFAMVNCGKIELDSCEFAYCSGNGIATFGGDRLEYINCNFHHNTQNGTYHTTTALGIDNGISHVVGSNSMSYDNGTDGFCADPGTKFYELSSCISHTNGGTGFNTYGNINGITPRMIGYHGCKSWGNALEGFSVHAANTVTLSGIQSLNDGNANNIGRNNGIIIQNDAIGQATLYRIQIINPIILGSKGHGIFIDSVTSDWVQDIHIDNPMISNIGTSISNTYDGIHVAKGARVYITQPIIRDDLSNMKYAVNFNTNSVDCRVIDIGGIQSGINGKFNNIGTNNYTICTTDAPINVKWFGVKGDGIADDILPIRKAIAAGVTLYWPPGTYKISDTITLASKQIWRGDNAIIKLDNSRGYIIPLLIVGTGASSSVFTSIEFDHNANGVPEPAMVSGLAYAHCCCVINMADDASFDLCVARNAWDSGFANGRWTYTGTGAPGSPFSITIANAYPQRARYTSSRAYDCGLGIHTTFDSGNQAGGGFNNLNGSLTQYDGCISTRCSTGFIADFGASASGNFVNCMAMQSTRDPGWGFWIADGPNGLVGCQALFCKSDGFVIPYQANGAILSGCYAFANGKTGFLIGSARTTLNGCISQDNSQLTTNTYSAYFLDSGNEPLNALSFVSCHAIGTTHKYGLDASGANTIQAQWAFGNLEGNTGTYNIGSYAIQILLQGTGARNLGIDTPVPSARLSISSDIVAYTTTPLGDTGNGGTFDIKNATTPDKKITFGYDGTNDIGVIQSMHRGITPKAVAINPSGGAVMVGNGTWNTGPMRLGSNYLWIDSSGRLRIKNSVPTSDTDGTVVGTQA